MEPIDLTTRQVYIYTVISIALSVLVALVPLFFGLGRQQRQLAIVGFVLTILGGVLLGLLLAIPVAAVFLYLIYRKSTRTAEVESAPETEIAASDDELPS